MSARYSAHQALASLGNAGQARIRSSRVLLIGLGGLGCAAAQYLVSSGVGAITLCDFDRIETTNLARQILYHAGDIGHRKVEVAAEHLARLNPEVSIHGVSQRIDADLAQRLLDDHDLLLDASDNYATRLAANAAALATRKPWVMGSCIRMEGQMMLFEPARAGPCYRCVYGSAPDTLEDCPGAGVFAPMAGIIGSGMAHLALQRLAGLEAPQGLHLLDGEHWHWRSLAVARRPGCRACKQDS